MASNTHGEFKHWLDYESQPRKQFRHESFSDIDSSKLELDFILTLRRCVLKFGDLNFPP